MNSVPEGRCPRRRRPGARTTLGVATAVLALALLGAVDPGERIPIPGDADRRPILRVPWLQSLVDADRPLELGLRVRNPARTDVSDLRLVVTIHGRLTSRVALQQSLDEGPTTGVVHAVTRDVSSVPAGGARTITIEQTREELGLATPGDAAVYPVRIALQSDGDIIDEALTAAVVTGDDAVEPLQVGVLLPFTGPPAELPDGRVDAERLDALIHPQSSARSLLGALRRHPDAVATLAVDGLSLATLERAQDGLEAVTDKGLVEQRRPEGASAEAAEAVLGSARTVAGQAGTDQLPLPYGRADLAALVRHGAEDEATRHVADATGDIERLTGHRPKARVLWPAVGVDGPTLDALSLAAETVVLSTSDVRSESARLTPEPARRLQTDEAGTLRALVPDPWIERTLTDVDRADGALTAARVLAEVASAHLERPGVADRGLLIAPPPHATPHGAVVDPLLAGLDVADFVELVDLAALRETGAGGDHPDATLSYPASARLEELPGGYVGALLQARSHVGSLDSIVTEDRGLVARLDRRLLQSASTAYREKESEGRALIGSIGDLVRDIETSVSVPDMPPVTLAAEEGTLPVRVRSQADVALRVKVTLRTAAYELSEGASREIVLAPGQDQLMSFDVRALAPGGTSPVQVLVTDPDEINELAVGTVVVRSAAFSVVGVVVTTAAALFLLFALWREIARRRRGTAGEPERTAAHRRTDARL